MKLSEAQQRILAELQNGETLAMEVAEMNFRYFMAGSGETVDAQTVRVLEDGGLIEPSGDGLFGDSQTYRLVTK